MKRSIDIQNKIKELVRETNIRVFQSIEKNSKVLKTTRPKRKPWLIKIYKETLVERKYASFMVNRYHKYKKWKQIYYMKKRW